MGSATLPRARATPATRAAPVLSAYSYWMLLYRRTWRGTVVISVVNPALFLIAMGAGLGKLVDRNDSTYLHGVSYLAFLAPGLLAAAMMQTAYLMSAGPVLAAARAGGNYRAVMATPTEPGEIYFGHLLFVAFRVLSSACAFGIVAAAFGAVPVATVAPLVGTATLVGLAFAAPVIAWAVTVERPPVLNAGFRFAIMPLYMFSGTFFPVAQLPAWLRVIADCTPLYQGTQLCRSISLGTASRPATFGHLGYLLALVSLGLVIGPHTYRSVLTR